LEDRMIVELYWQRDENAISATAAKYGPYCKTIANNILHDVFDAEECVNDTYAAAWNAMPDDRPERLSHYLGRMTRWIALDRLDRKRSQKRGGGQILLSLDELRDCAASGPAIEDAVELQELCAAINRFLASLPPAERQLFLARYWFMASVAEIAEKFSFSQSKVKSRLYRTRNKLRCYLEEEGLC